MPHAWPVVFRKRCINQKLIGARNSVSSVTANAFGGPRQGVVFECYKGVKKLFRKTSRKKIQNVIENRFEAINHCFSSRNINSFWNEIKAHQKRKISSSLNAQIIADFYRDVMCNDSIPFDEFQQMVHNTVKTTCREWSVKPEHIAFTDRQIERAIIALRKPTYLQG